LILVDTSVWIDHLRRTEPALVNLLQSSQTLTHRFIIGELAVGSIRRRAMILSDLKNLPQTIVASDDEVMHAIDRWKLFGSGIGYIDAHLLAAAAVTPGALLWTRDKRLRVIAERLSLHAALS
jgi:predicted nucleic acid-binding protein